jgi:hypothetical protein
MINDHDLAVLLLSTSAFLLATTVTFATLWLRARERFLRGSLERARRVDLSPDIQHLVHAVDSIAVEVERISEGQRFTTQILADRVLSDTPQQKRVSSTGRVITPH